MITETFSLTTRIARPAEEVFAWHERPGAFERLCPPWEKVEPVSSTGGLRDGARVTVRNKIGPFSATWCVEHRDYAAGVEFRDVQLSGPFAEWDHVHRFEPDGPDACWLTDSIRYRIPGGTPARFVAGRFVRGKLERLFAWRHATTKADLERASNAGSWKPRRILVAGASGSVGRALVPFLTTQGHTVVRLVRRAARSADEVSWNPSEENLDTAAIEGVDAIINLSGEAVAAGRWTQARRLRIMSSRVDATRTLVKAIRESRRKPEVLINASAVGFYGDRGDDELTEQSEIGHGFLAEVCLAWETHAEGAARVGVRTAQMRFGIVLTPQGGALAKLLPVFRAGLGGRMGDGRQWMSWVSVDDAIGAILHVIENPQCSGPVNTVAPVPVTNAEFTMTLGEILHRPTVFTVPASILRLGLGAMADETLLESARALPTKLAATGYRFRHTELSKALRHVLGRDLPGKV
jgi:uncharacterized protein (TIGR01777 family)